MLTNPNSSGFCLFCYKIIKVSAQTGQNQESIKKFVKTVNRLDKNHELNVACEVLVTEKLLDCCTKCKYVIEDICETYHQLKFLELKLDSKFDSLLEKVNYANKVPTRWMHMNSVLEEAFPRDLDKKAESQKKIRQFRQIIIEAGHQRKLLSEPRVRLRRTAYCVQPKQSYSSAFTNPDEATEYDEMPKLDDYSENIDNDVNAELNFINVTEIEDTVGELESDDNCDIVTSYIETTRETARFQDPLIQIKEEHQVFVERKTKTPKNKRKFHQENKSTLLSSRKPITKKPTTEKLYDCKRCRQKLNSIHALKIHLKGHKKPNSLQWRCKTCGKSYGTSFALQMHVRIHTNTKIKCSYCEQTYAYQFRLTKHLKEKHGDEKGVDEEIRMVQGEINGPKMRTYLTKTTDSQMQVLVSDKKVAYCNNCKKPFASLRILKAHMNSTSCTKKTNDFEEIINCKVCGKMFSLDNELWVHQRDVHKEKVCINCGKQFKLNQKLKLHLEYHKDPKEWKFECEICEKKCVDSYKLKEHMSKHLRKDYRRNALVKKGKDELMLNLDKYLIKKKRVRLFEQEREQTDQNVNCGHCGTTFNSNKELWRHLKEIHGKLVCLECGKEFTRIESLKLHLEYHKNPKDWDFECDVCGKKCAAAYKLREHMAVHAKKQKNGEILAMKRVVMMNAKDKADLNLESVSRKEPPLSVTRLEQNRYGLRKNRVTSLSTVVKVSRDDKQTMDMNEKLIEDNVNAESSSFDEVKELNKNMDESDGKKMSVNDVNALDENNFLDEKGDCFGDGNLVQIEDLD